MRSPVVQSVKRDLQGLKVLDFVALAASLKDEKIASLELFRRRDARPRFTFLSTRHADTMCNFSRALAWSISTGGWLQRLELGFCLCHRDLQLLVHALCLSKTLKHLSFANSGLGDANLQVLARGFRDCAPLQVLCLAGCNLTDAIAPVLASILKANLSRKIQEDWQNSLRVYKERTNTCATRCGLRALDLSWNKLTVVSMREMCTIFHLGPSIEALDVSGNDLELESQKLFADVMNEWGILKFVDLRNSETSSLLGVLEKGLYTTETRHRLSDNHAHRKPKMKNWSSKKQLRKQEDYGKMAREVASDGDRFSLRTRCSLLSGSRENSHSLRSSVETAAFSPITPVTPTSLNTEHSPWNHDDHDNRRISCSTSTDDLQSSTEKPVGFDDASSIDGLQWSNLHDEPTTVKHHKSEWNGFLTDISQALLQLNDRLDKLIGPSGASEDLRMRLLSLV